MRMTITASLPKTHSCEDVYSQFRAQLCWRCRPHWEPTKWSRPCRCDASSSPVPGTVSEAMAAPVNTKPVTLKISSPLDTHLVTWYFTPDQVWRSHQGETQVIKMHAAQYTAPQHSTLWHNILLPSSSKWHRCVMLSFHSDHCSHKTIQTWYPACMQTTETPPHCVVLYQHHLGSWMTTEIFRRHW